MKLAPVVIGTALFAFGSVLNAAEPVKPPGNDDCLTCHADRDAKRSNGSSVFVVKQKLDSSVHGQAGVACVDCHSDLAKTSDFPHKAAPAQGRLRLLPRRGGRGASVPSGDRPSSPRQAGTAGRLRGLPRHSRDQPGPGRGFPLRSRSPAAGLRGLPLRDQPAFSGFRARKGLHERQEPRSRLPLLPPQSGHRGLRPRARGPEEGPGASLSELPPVRRIGQVPGRAHRGLHRLLRAQRSRRRAAPRKRPGAQLRRLPRRPRRAPRLRHLLLRQQDAGPAGLRALSSLGKPEVHAWASTARRSARATRTLPRAPTATASTASSPRRIRAPPSPPPTSRPGSARPATPR